MGWFMKLKLANKILAAVAVAVAMTCVVGAYGLSAIQEMRGHLENTYGNNLLSLHYLGNARVAQVLHSRVHVRLVGLRDAEEIEAAKERSRVAWNQYEQNLK